MESSPAVGRLLGHPSHPTGYHKSGPTHSRCRSPNDRTLVKCFQWFWGLLGYTLKRKRMAGNMIDVQRPTAGSRPRARQLVPYREPKLCLKGLYRPHRHGGYNYAHHNFSLCFVSILTDLQRIELQHPWCEYRLGSCCHSLGSLSVSFVLQCIEHCCKRLEWWKGHW